MRRRGRFTIATVVLGLLATGAVALSDGPDVIYSDCDDITNWGAVSGIRGYSLETQTCNVGDTDLSWSATGPLLGMNAYQLKDGRLR